jgi:DNA-binding CsgD family transcriptional regulator
VAELSEVDYRRMLDLAAAIIEGMAGGSPWGLIARELNDSLRGSATVYQGGRWRPRDALAWAPETTGKKLWDKRTTDQYDHSHPLANVYTMQHTAVPLTVSDVIDERSWRRNPCYDATHHELDGSTRHLALPLPASAGHGMRSLVVCRPNPDFDDRDRKLARRLQPLLTSVDHHLKELQLLRDRVKRAARRIDPTEHASDIGLTARELTVLTLMAEGLTAAAIAHRLVISVHTVTKHQDNLYRKLGTRDRLTTVLLGQQLGLVPSL